MAEGSNLESVDSHLAEQVAVNTDNITRLFAEHEKIRERLHTVENDRATVLLLAQKLDDLTRQLPSMVERAAQLAAEKVGRQQMGRWPLDIALLAVGVALIGLAIKLIVG
jgi:tetrahydromethanopterin S-methyltransferase subunit G